MTTRLPWIAESQEMATEAGALSDQRTITGWGAFGLLASGMLAGIFAGYLLRGMQADRELDRCQGELDSCRRSFRQLLEGGTP